MEISDIIQGGGLILSGAAVTKIASIAMKAWAARNGKTEVANDPLNVNKLDKYVTRGEFNKAMERNEADHKRMTDEAAADHERMERENNSAHENIFNRLTRNDRDMGEIKGLLTGVANDLQLIKGKLFKTR
ncbi:MAG: hypothetical protein J6S51_03525 [Kiritimatiellae bacterium]|nr:hypothetical protein [Kiritimatiellia bacterium]